jgi:hypothetical protein
LAVVFCACVSSEVWAWNAAGHRLITAIAWNEMNPKAREETNRLLRRHPDYPRWLKRAGKEDADRRVFIEASTWPDDIRNDKRFYSASKADPTPTLPGFPDMERRSNWHYVNIPLNASFGGKPFSGRLDRQLPELVKTLGESGSELERTYALPWLIHLAGDAHQPLHASARVDAVGKWDKSGNTRKVHNPFNPRRPVSTLHVFWDDLPGPPWLRGNKLDTTARALASAHAQLICSVESKRWIEESWQLARKKAYPSFPSKSDALPEISKTFYEASRKIADRRIAQAGFRLACVLNQSFESFAAKRPPLNRQIQR